MSIPHGRVDCGSAASFSAWLRSAWDFIYPPSCPCCGKSLPGPGGVCRECRAEFAGAGGEVCGRCGAPVGPYLHGAESCVHCRGDTFAFERVFALGPYAGRLRGACRRAQFDPSGRIVRGLTELYIERWGTDLRSRSIDVVLPVPAHWTTRVLRAAAPADVAAQQLARFLSISCDLHILRKARRTRPQTSLSPTLRRDNLRQAFRIVPGVRLDGVHVLLVDDVLTTGTTAHRCAAALRRSGAVSVTVAVLARGIGQ